MNYKINEMNPIEAIRMAERISQQEFAVKIGYPGKDRYQHHMRNFTQDIIEKVRNVYDRDLTIEVINHLKYKCRQLSKQLKQQKGRVTKTDLVEERSVGSISSILEKV